jgi:3-oxoacyl-[acyl-carrier-protein] synthase-1
MAKQRAPDARRRQIGGMQMRRVVITGIGVVSSIGSDAVEVTASLREGRSGIVFAPDFAEHGFRCQIYGKPTADIVGQVDKRVRRFMGDGAAWNYIAMNQAIADAGLTEAEVSNERTGLIMGSGGPSTLALFEAHKTVIANGNTRRIGPFAVPKAMS